LDVFVWRERQRGEQVWLRDENDVVGFGEVLEEQAQPSEVSDLDEVRDVDDGCQHLAGVVDAMGFLDEALFAAEVATVGIDLKGFAQDAQRAVDDWRDKTLVVIGSQCALDHTLAGATVRLVRSARAACRRLLAGAVAELVMGDGGLVKSKVGENHRVASGSHWSYVLVDGLELRTLTISEATWPQRSRHGKCVGSRPS
jgi:hypothetical protein